jgi:hypothetical protein
MSNRLGQVGLPAGPSFGTRSFPFSAAGIFPLAGGGATIGFNGSAPRFDFADAAVQAVPFTIAVPSDLAPDGDIRFRMRWSIAATWTTPARVGRWLLQSEPFGDNGVVSTAAGSLTNQDVEDISIANYTSGQLAPLSTAADFTITGAEPNDVLVMVLSRIGNVGADTLSAVASWFGFVAEYDAEDTE